MFSFTLTVKAQEKDLVKQTMNTNGDEFKEL